MLEIKLDLAIQTTEFLSSLCEDLADVENVKGIIGQSTLDGDVVSCIVLISEDSDDVVEDILQLGIAVINDFQNVGLLDVRQSAL